MKRKAIVGILIATMAVSMLSGCGLFKSTDKNSEAVGNDTEIESEIGTEMTTETQGSSETEIESESQVAMNDTTNQNSETNNTTDNGGNGSENKPVEPEEPVHTCSYTTLKTDASNHWYACSCGKTANKGAHGYDDEYDASCNTCGYTRSVPERPVEPETPAGPGNISWNGGDITLGSIGITVPTLEEFNNVALVPGVDNEWTGAVNTDKKALSDMNVIYMNTEEFSRALEKQGVSPYSVNGFTVYDSAIAWSWNTAGNEAFKLERTNDGYYRLIINMSLKDCPYGQHNLADWNKDIVKYLCTIVSSEPVALYNMIYEDIHGTTCISDTGWTAIGDCQVHYDNPNSYKNHYVYWIKAK